MKSFASTDDSFYEEEKQVSKLTLLANRLFLVGCVEESKRTRRGEA